MGVSYHGNNSSDREGGHCGSSILCCEMLFMFVLLLLLLLLLMYPCMRRLVVAAVAVCSGVRLVPLAPPCCACPGGGSGRSGRTNTPTTLTPPIHSAAPTGRCRQHSAASGRGASKDVMSARLATVLLLMGVLLHGVGERMGVLIDPRGIHGVRLSTPVPQEQTEQVYCDDGFHCSEQKTNHIMAGIILLVTNV